MVPLCSVKITRVPTYSSYPPNLPFHIPGYHRLWPHFPERSAKTNLDDGNWAVPLSLAATDGISVDFYSSGYLDVSVHQVRLHILCIQIWTTPKSWVAPFGNLRIKAILPAPRSLSQTFTSFIASYCQGIHRMRLVTLTHTTLNDSMNYELKVTIAFDSSH